MSIIGTLLSWFKRYRVNRCDFACDRDSDGILIAIADGESQEVNKFNSLGDDLACNLRKSFSTLFYPDVDSRLKRKHRTVWSTVGYFDEV